MEQTVDYRRKYDVYLFSTLFWDIEDLTEYEPFTFEEFKERYILEMESKR